MDSGTMTFEGAPETTQRDEEPHRCVCSGQRTQIEPEDRQAGPLESLP